MNKAIYNKMLEAARTVFAQCLEAPAGIYTLDDLAKVGTKSKTAPKGVFFLDSCEDIITIDVDEFSCSYPSSLAFVYAHRFEKLARISKKDRATFIREEEQRGEIIAECTLNSDITSILAACEDLKSGCREVLQGAFLDFSNNIVCCCNGHVMHVTGLQDANICNHDGLDSDGVIIPCAFAKAAAGCKVSIY